MNAFLFHRGLGDGAVLQAWVTVSVRTLELLDAHVDAKLVVMTVSDPKRRVDCEDLDRHIAFLAAVPSS